MVFCPNCGTSVDESVRVCPKCGRDMPVLVMAEPSTKFCYACGVKIQKDADFCPHCGARQNPDSDGSSEVHENTCNPQEKKIPVTPWGKEVTSDKSTAAGLILSIIVPGLGTMYSGRIIRGLCLFFGIWVLVIIGVSIVSKGVDFESAAVVLGGVAFIFATTIALYLYSVYDGFRNCEIIHDLYKEATGYKS